MTFILVALGGATGAVLRYLIDGGLCARVDAVFPWGTLTANTLACAFLGFVTVLTLPEPWLTFAATGFLGALSTYSTFAYETLRLVRGGARWLGAANVVVSMLVGLGAVILGASIARAVAG